MEDENGGHLYQKDMFLPFGGKTKQSVTMKDAEWPILDRKALGAIQLFLYFSVDFNISKAKTTEGV